MAQVEVNIQLAETIYWQPETECNFEPENTVDVWRIYIPLYKDQTAHFLNLLQPDEIVRANRYVQEKDRIRFIISRAALREIVSRYINQPAKGIIFGSGPNKKPFIVGAALRYNVSHSANWVLIAISKTDVGVDTETIDASFKFESILEDYFSPAEISFINGNPKNFFLLWTRKEALTKATAQGLDENLKHIPSLDGMHITNTNILKTDKNWLVKSFKTDAENQGSIVCEKIIKKLCFFEIKLSKNV
ncbi:4'-phosphopantetheinyl transferase family protein [Mucilaginibacter ginsenosidivorax]|nr:4'-phosphopantetheinyl transferase superfamily protein [Mucilaginibacter ginsenosidivorax]